MIKWFCIILLAVPRVLYSQIVLMIMNCKKDKYSYERRYKVVRNTCKWIVKVTRCKMNIENVDIIRQAHENGRIYVCNHFSVFEAVMLLALSEKPLIFISKKENSKVPFLRTHMKAVETICIDRESVKQSLKVCKEAGLRAKSNADIVLFAEGTRSKNEDVAPFKAALPMIVHYSETEVVLVCFHNSKNPVKFRWVTYPNEKVNIKFFAPLTYYFYLENKKEYAIITHDLIQAKLDEFKKGN